MSVNSGLDSVPVLTLLFLLARSRSLLSGDHGSVFNWIINIFQ